LRYSSVGATGLKLGDRFRRSGALLLAASLVADLLPDYSTHLSSGEATFGDGPEGRVYFLTIVSLAAGALAANVVSSRHPDW
jgi:hypothetical protein